MCGWNIDAIEYMCLIGGIIRGKPCKLKHFA